MNDDEQLLARLLAEDEQANQDFFARLNADLVAWASEKWIDETSILLLEQMLADGDAGLDALLAELDMSPPPHDSD